MPRSLEHSQSGGAGAWSPAENQVIQVRVGRSSESSQFAFLSGTGAQRRGWLRVRDVGVFDTGVVMKALRMREPPPHSGNVRKRDEQRDKDEHWGISTRRHRIKKDSGDVGKGNLTMR